MSKNVEFKLNSAGVRELLQSGAMQTVITSFAGSVQSKAGSGFGADVLVGKKRVVGRVYAATADARRKNNENNTLLKSL